MKARDRPIRTQAQLRIQVQKRFAVADHRFVQAQRQRALVDKTAGAVECERFISAVLRGINDELPPTANPALVDELSRLRINVARGAAQLGRGFGLQDRLNVGPRGIKSQSVTRQIGEKALVCTKNSTEV